MSPVRPQQPSLPRRVLVTGATGFIGGRLVEVMALTGVCEPRPLVHSTSAAARITRFPLDFVVADLLDRESVDRAMEGCDAVVHLARGGKAVMRKGLQNVLDSAVAHGVSRFVHMSSVAVYGNNPPPASATETAEPDPGDLEYGKEKLEQERLVRRYGRRHGLPIVILRPPNVYGPFAPFTSGLIGKIRAGAMAVVDGGTNPCNLVYVDNLVQATLLALWRPEAVGETFFVTDDERVTWNEALRDVATLVNGTVHELRAQELVPAPRPRVVRDSIRALPRVLLGGAFRSALRQIPLVERAEAVVYDRVNALSEERKQRIRLRISGASPFPRSGRSAKPAISAEDNIVAAQRRTVSHSNEKARRLLGYTAPVSYREGMALTEQWLRASRVV